MHSDAVVEFLRGVRQTCHSRTLDIGEGSVLWRSQLGFDLRETGENEDGIGAEPVAHPPDRMKPLKGQASEGRANPSGIPCLYLATDKETAMSEVRPWLGTYISVGQFRVLRPQRVVDCTKSPTKPSIFYGRDPGADKRDDIVWEDIDRGFSEPVGISDETNAYVPTQILAELFKAEGFDGVMYRSALGRGSNLALFDLEAAEIVNGFLFEARKLLYEFNEIANPYYVQKNEP